MTEEQFQKFIECRYKGQMRWMSERSATYKRLYHFVSAITIALTTGAPILTALGSQKWIILSVTASIALLTGLQRLFQFKDLWTAYRATVEAMKREWSYLQAGIRDYKRMECAEMRSVFVDRIEEILAQENAAWTMGQNPKVSRSSRPKR
ncbi:MAG: DUF4231 domain-containing protein [Spirochaetaceae bacterium]|nr:DUF4231 domain-containing protein [Spirochaetaceae bacterium]